MAVDLPPIPPAVVEFAQKNQIEHVQQDVKYFQIKKSDLKSKNISAVYYGVSKNLPAFEKNKQYLYDHFHFILIENGVPRLATPEELEILNRALFL